MNRKRIRVRRERDGAIVYDPKSRNYAFLEGNLFDGEVFLQRVNLHVAKVLGLSPEQVLSIEFVGNGRSALAELSAPIGVYFEITPKCNLQCKHCYKCGLPDKPALSYSEIVRVIDELVGLGLLEFRLCGNEPIIHPDFDKVALHAKSKGLYVSTNTNGFYGDRLIEKLLVVQFDEVIVSLDGLEETHDWIRAPSSFKRAVHVLEELHAAGTKSRINMTVSKFNIDEVEAVGDLAV
ncbi:radical SAM protein, partial [Patescibacteria group bacterium]|nr:radical SAM protein [Patescibacteria group bacterium]